MAKKIKIVLILIVIAVLLFFGGWFAHSKFVDPEIKIIETTKIETKYIKQNVTTQAGLLECYKSPIDIDGSMKANMLTVIAADKCKESRKGFKLKSYPKIKKNIFGFSYGMSWIEKQNYHLFMLSYQRRFGFLSIGGGPIILKKSDNNTFSGGFKISANLIF